MSAQAIQRGGVITPETLGHPAFRQRFGVKYAYVAGAMYRGISSPQLVVRMGRAGLIGFFGAGGLSIQEIGRALDQIQAHLRSGEPFGMNLLANYGDPALELETVRLYLERSVRFIEAAAFTQPTPAVVLFRLRGLRRTPDGHTVGQTRILAKVSRVEAAEAFMSPPPGPIVDQLLRDGAVTPEQAQLARGLPLCADLCVEADSAGHTDGGIPTILLPTMLRLRDQVAAQQGYGEPICVGLGGGIGTPEAAAAAFVMGADFILTGSINQCTQESGMSAGAKRMLQEMDVQDTEYAPAGDMFEMGAKVQVLRKGVFFPARANKLHALYTHYDGLDAIPDKIRKQLETSMFKRGLAEVWEETKEYLRKKGQHALVARAEASPKQKMALVFRWYFGYSSRLAFSGTGEDRVNYQVHTGPALGAFNQWVRGTALESFVNRHADEIGKLLMRETAAFLNRQYDRLRAEPDPAPAMAGAAR